MKLSEETELEILEPAQVVAPGQVLKRELDGRGWSQKDLSRIIGRPVQAINEIAGGQKAITPETAIQLAAAFGQSAEFWLDLEATYRLRLAKQKPAEPEIVTRRRLYSLVPIAELQQRGWISMSASTTELVSSVCRFLQIPSLDALPSVPVANLHVSMGAEPHSANLAAWLKRAEALAREEEPAVGYDPKNLEAVIPELRELSTHPRGPREVPKVLGDAGIRLVLITHLPKTYLDGVQFKLDGEPVVGMTTRLDRIDNFWFVLFHELAHLHYQDDGNIDEKLEDGGDEKEVQRSDLAASWLIGAEQFKSFRDAHPSPTWPDIVEGARTIGVHPAILLGRLQHVGALGWDIYRAGLSRVRPLVEDWLDKPIALNA
jgi:HTH-type transcriptional regulator / antitoxin HigA